MSKAIVMDASQARNAFGSLGETVRTGPIEVMRHGKLVYAMLSPDLYERAKVSLEQSASELQRMQKKFAQLVANMQTPEAASAYDSLIHLSAKNLPSAVTKARRTVARRSVESKRRVVR